MILYRIEYGSSASIECYVNDIEIEAVVLKSNYNESCGGRVMIKDVFKTREEAEVEIKNRLKSGLEETENKAEKYRQILDKL